MRYKLPFILMLLATVLTGCVDEPLLNDKLTQGEEIKANGPTLTFSVDLTAMDAGGTVGSRVMSGIDPTYYESWIDTQEKFRVLFFVQPESDNTATNNWKNSNSNNNYVFLFESTTRWVNQLPADANGQVRWNVIVPLYQIGEPDSYFAEKAAGANASRYYTDTEEYWRDIREILRKCKFKIAILANHPKPNQTGGGPNWTIADSYMNGKNANATTTYKTTADWKTINDLHHCTYDDTYHKRSGFDGSSTYNSEKDAYSYVMGDQTKHGSAYGDRMAMGPFTDWVVQRSLLYGDGFGGTFNNKEQARKWIRDRWRPALIYNEDADPNIPYQPLYRSYRNLWYVWNFGGCAADNALPISRLSSINEHVDEWEDRNGRHLREWHAEGLARGGTLSALTDNESDVDLKSYLDFRPGNSRAVKTQLSNGKYYYGIQMSGGTFTFSLRSHGTVFVTYSGGGTVSFTKTDNTNSDITIEDDKEPDTSFRDADGRTIYTKGWYMKNMADEASGSITTTGDVTIYEIEFVRDEYLYLTDREGVTPSPDNPIPMYGVQDFEPLQGFFEEGSTFDLTSTVTNSENKKYTGQSISLLRAVAKVEVLIPKSIGVPKHVLMRSLNRHSRCEPIDVQTPTNQLWKPHDAGCEWDVIQQYGAMFDSSNGVVSDCRSKLSYFWGSWIDWGWTFNGQSGTTYRPTKPSYGFPHIFNPYINRSDFASFIDVTDFYSDSYYHYVLYMGENTIDATTNHYKLSGRPMVPHIEIRFDHRYPQAAQVAVNDDINLEDNDCYRFYFVEKGFARGALNADGTPNIGRTNYETTYERNTTYTSQHWPILRNHLYRFTIKGVPADGMCVLACEVEHRNQSFTFN